MRPSTMAWPFFAVLTCVCTALAPGGHALAQKAAPAKNVAAMQPTAAETASQARARALLIGMAEFLGGTQRFRVSLRSGYDVVQASGQKLEFTESRQVTLSRPDRLRVEGERSGGGKMLTVFTGSQIMLADAGSNVYATTPQMGGLDASIVHFVRDLGMRLPLAAMLLSTFADELGARAQSVDYVEQTDFYGAPAHHVAVRSATVDFQVWIADGERPLPQRVVITYKQSKGEPQFWASFSDWDLAPQLGDATFDATPPAGAQKIAFAAELPRLDRRSRPAKSGKGAK